MPDTIQADEIGEAMQGILECVEQPDAQEPLRKWTEEFSGDIGVTFQQSKAPDGTAWPPLKQPRPAGHNPGTRPLIDTGDLMLSMISDAEGHIENITADSITFGTSVDYAAVHQTGSRKKNIPARPFLDVTDEQLDKLGELVGDHVLAQIAAL